MVSGNGNHRSHKLTEDQKNFTVEQKNVSKLISSGKLFEKKNKTKKTKKEKQENLIKKKTQKNLRIFRKEYC